jgi:hypothetical protein
MITGRKSVMINRASQISRGDYAVICHYEIYGQYPDQIPFEEIEKFESGGMLCKTYTNEKFDVYKIAGSQLCSSESKNSHGNTVGLK